MRVLELGDNVSAAYCGKLLTRWGADVVRVELPGDPPRPGSDPAAEALDRYLNGGKRRVTVDYRTSGGRAMLDRLAAAQDILLTDALPRELDQWDLLSAGGERGPGVRTTITPFGLSGPYRDFEATSSTLLAMGGYTYLTGEAGRTPLTLPGYYAEYQAGQFAYTATLAASMERRRRPDSAPRTIEVSVLECVTALHQFTTAYYTYSGWIRKRSGNRWRNFYPNTMLPCKDGWVGMIVGGGEFWPSFCLMIGHPELPEDPRFATPAARLEHADELDEIIVAALAGRTMEEIFTEAQTTWRVPVTMLADIDRLLDDPHLNERGFWRPVDDAAGATLRYPGSPFRFDGEQQPPEAPAAAPGADDAAVLVPLVDAALMDAAPMSGGLMNAGAGVHAGGGSTVTGESERAPAGPLRGVRVLDLTRIYAGPLATRILADLGAEVIKVEAITGRGPAVVPAVREAVNYADGAPGDQPWNRQGAFNELNRCKKSIALDLKSEQGRDILLRLVAISDVVMENFSVRAMERLGLDYERLREVNERLIYIAMPGFGISGPYRDYVILGPGLEPMTGLASMLGYGGGDPMVSTVALPDAIGGVTAAAAAVTALQRRAETGRGALVDYSLQEAAIATLGERFIERQLSGRSPPRAGNAHAVYAPHGVYRCRGDDEWIAIAARSDDEWRTLCAAAGRGWADDTRFATPATRQEHRLALDEAIESWTALRDKTELMHALQRDGVPAGALVDAAELVADPQLGERGFFVQLDHPAVGPRRYQGTPFLLDGRRGSAWRAAPTLGEHNAEVLGGLLGLTEAELEALYGEGVIADRPPIDQAADEARQA